MEGHHVVRRAAAFVLSVVLVLWSLVAEVRKTGAGGAPARETRTPGDTNCDGELDLSDAITVLNFLFLNTAGPPCPIADPPELVARIAELEAELERCKYHLSEAQWDAADCRAGSLPDTGQAACYDQASNEIPCDSATCPGQDGRYYTGCRTDGRFLDNGDGTVTDRCTLLMWLKRTADVNQDGQENEDDLLQWCEALSYCGNLKFGGSFDGWDDWRLPNVRELQSIINYGRSGSSIDPAFDALAEDRSYWTSTPHANLFGAWTVSFANEGSSIDEKSARLRILAVRGP
jgi:hypothetical protein